jgi:hypothetical protein
MWHITFCSLLVFTHCFNQEDYLQQYKRRDISHISSNLCIFAYMTFTLDLSSSFKIDHTLYTAVENEIKWVFLIDQDVSTKSIIDKKNHVFFDCLDYKEWEHNF